MKKIVYKIWAKFLSIFGDFKIFNWPFWLVYDNSNFEVTGDKVIEIMEILKPGDIICRGYNHYLDGKFIDDPLKFSHGAIYLGNNEILHAVAEGVSRINVVEFCQCDRIVIFRPKKYAKQGIKNALKYEGMDYDFAFKNANSAIYCFELCALAYPNLDIKKCNIRKFGFIKKSVYLAKSFFNSKDLRCIFHYNPKYNIDILINK